jgi:hypothetical protein
MDTTLFNPALNPFMLWADLALKTTEMLVSSSQVIAERTDRLTRTGAASNLPEHQELARTGNETLQAPATSPMDVWARAWQQWFAACAMMAVPTTGRGHARELARTSADTARLTAAALTPAPQVSAIANPKRPRRAKTRAARR